MALATPSTPAFSWGGAATPAATGAAPSLFGSPASTPSLFGGATVAATPVAPSLFAAPASTPSLFGAAATPASAPTAGGLFGGAAAASTPSLFGAASTPASTPSLFGGATGSLFGGGAIATSTPSLFGGTAASTPSLFGAAPAASTPASSAFGGGGLFGFSQPAGQTPLFGSAFGSTQVQPQQQQAGALAAFGAPLQPDLAAVREIDALKDAFAGGPGHPRYRFACLLLNVVDHPAQRFKPPGVDDLAWREAMQRAGGADNPDRLWPVLAAGLSDLRAREAAQAAALDEHKARLSAAASAVRELGRRREALLSGRLEAAKRREVQLGQQLLRLARRVDALEGRFASAMGHQPPGARAAAGETAERLAALERGLSSASAAGLPRRIAAVAERAQARLEAYGGGREGDGGAGGEGGEPGASLDEESLCSLLSLLKQQQASLAALEGVLQADNRDLAIMLDTEGDAVPMAVITT